MKTIFVFFLSVCSSLYSQLPSREECEDDNENVACCFIGMPDRLSQRMTIAGMDEPGRRLIIRGEVKKSDGTSPYPNVLLYAYHTNEKGIYPKRGNETGIRKWHGYLHGWLKTDSLGRYEIHTIRPEPYPSGNAPAHIHIVVREPNGRTYYVNDIVFSDDPYVTPRYRSSLSSKKDDGIVTVQKNDTGVLEGTRTILTR